MLPRVAVAGRLEKVCDKLLDNMVRRIRDREWVYTVNVASILENKGADVISVTPETTVGDTAALLAEKRIGSVLAIDARGKIAGVISERDIVMGLAERGAEVLTVPVSEIMTRKV